MLKIPFSLVRPSRSVLLSIDRWDTFDLRYLHGWDFTIVLTGSLSVARVSSNFYNTVERKIRKIYSSFGWFRSTRWHRLSLFLYNQHFFSKALWYSCFYMFFENFKPILSFCELFDFWTVFNKSKFVQFWSLESLIQTVFFNVELLWAFGTWNPGKWMHIYMIFTTRNVLKK